MDRNALNVVEKLPRTQFENIYSHKTTFSTGKLVPFMAKEILPKDNINMSVNVLIKTTTPKTQTMDTLIADVHFLFVPDRLTWKNFKEFMGENLNNKRIPRVNRTMPMTTAPTGGWKQGTIADHLGIPTEKENIEVNSRFFRGIVLCWNEYYRDQQRQDFADFSDGDENTAGSNGGDIILDAIKGGQLLPVNKLKDMYTTSLLEPQAGESVTLPLGLTAPVIDGGTGPLARLPMYNATTGVKLTDYGDVTYGMDGLYKGANSVGAQTPPIGVHLQTDLTQATAATINQLRQAFSIQRMLETINRGGSRYVEQLVNRWGITNPSDATMQRPEYIGGFSTVLNMDMVVQTTGTTENPLGQMSGFSNTLNADNQINGAFEEHGILFGFIMVRNRNSYQQGLHPKFSRKDMEDMYQPEYANAIGDVPIYNREIYASGTSKDSEVFGYKQYGAEYRNEDNIITGQFRSNATNSWDIYHYADDYEDTPVNNETWIQSNAKNVDRTLTLESSEGYDQFLAEISIDEIATRSIPAHNIPGYITSL